MTKYDKILKDHVSAARNWLGKAESSLDNKNSIRGDLHIMLAEAELKRAKEKRVTGFNFFWLKYIIPLPVAILLLGGYWLAGDLNKVNKESNISTAIVSTVPDRKASSLDSELTKQVAAPETIKTVSVNEDREYTESVRFENTQAKVAAEEPPRTVTPPKVQQPLVQPVKETQVPSREMQQLMRTAKKTLREQ